MKCPLPLNVSNPCQTIKVAAGEMTEPVHTFLKDMFRNLLFECISKDNYINGLKWSLTQFTVNKRNQLVRLLLD